MNNHPNTFTMPVEPLQNGWNKKWDYEALEMRLERFGLKLNKNAQGYTVRYASSGNTLSLLSQDYRGLPHIEVCELVEDLEVAEAHKRAGYLA